MRCCVWTAWLAVGVLQLFLFLSLERETYLYRYLIYGIKHPMSVKRGGLCSFGCFIAVCLMHTFLRTPQKMLISCMAGQKVKKQERLF